MLSASRRGQFGCSLKKALIASKFAPPDSSRRYQPFHDQPRHRVAGFGSQEASPVPVASGSGKAWVTLVPFERALVAFGAGAERFAIGFCLGEAFAARARAYPVCPELAPSCERPADPEHRTRRHLAPSREMLRASWQARASEAPCASGISPPVSCAADSCCPLG
jgi:hypothetical protein